MFDMLNMFCFTIFVGTLLDIMCCFKILCAQALELCWIMFCFKILVPSSPRLKYDKDRLNGWTPPIGRTRRMGAGVCLVQVTDGSSQSPFWVAKEAEREAQ